MDSSIIRLACSEDIPKVGQIYADILQGPSAPATGWLPQIYPTLQTAQDGFDRGELYVCVVDGTVVAAAKINKEQVDVYGQISWQYPAHPEQVLVIHTLVVSPSVSKQGYGEKFIDFYEGMARQLGCPYLRLDTNQKNAPARQFYAKLGYHERGIVPCTFCGIPNVQLVCLEKRLPL